MLGEMSCVLGENDDEHVCSSLKQVSDRQDDDGGGQEQGGGDVGDAVYSFVHRVGDEKGLTGQRWSMKSVRLPRKMSSTDQNQTPSAAHEGGLGQIVRQTLKSQILFWKGRLLCGILTDDITRSDQNRRTRGQTEEQQQHSS